MDLQEISAHAAYLRDARSCLSATPDDDPDILIVMDQLAEALQGRPEVSDASP